MESEPRFVEKWEQIGYLKVWLGIFVVTLISLVGWLASHYGEANLVLIVLNVAAVLVLVILVGLIHRTIQRLVQNLEEL